MNRKLLSLLTLIAIVTVSVATAVAPPDMYDAKARLIPKSYAVGPSASDIDDAQTAATGANWVQLADHACQQVSFINDTGFTILVRYGTAAKSMPLPDGSGYTFRGLASSNGLQIKRKDSSNTQVTISYNWEKF